MPATPSLLKPTWSNGLQLGPLVQLDLPLGERGYLRIEAAFPYRDFRESLYWTQDYGEIHFHRGVHLHLVAGAGMSF
jgi:hypothetical protein